MKILITASLAAALLAGCTQMPDGTYGPVWQHPSTGYVPTPVHIYPTIRCREIRDGEFLCE